ncbi:YPO3983 family protein [Enterobacter sp. RHBSTW-00901]|uniref:YPO3983 family protein n=1 Tax=Enterobacter sp. RHBSTW-00901 TaxID=2742669 RepID=UPI0020175F69|nr:YPO3983 family protein [Enterobacter sp. RHBSTW-00901]
MINSFNPSMFLPCTLFETVTRFYDTDADDMQCGDMGEQELLSLGLGDVSEKVDPYRLVRYDFPDKHHLDDFFGSSSAGTKISHEECVDILFTEMKELSQIFSFQGEYKTLIGELIDHFRYGNGSGFYTQRLNSAFHDRINGYFIGNPLLIIKGSIQTELSLNNRKTSVPEFLGNIKRKLLKSTLPKYNKKMDRVNGLGISVHDIAAQKITLLNFQQYAIGWSATVHFLAQDHFGLDVTDIKSELYSQFRFFRIWFFLQRHRNFAFKPFFTNFQSVSRVEMYQ